MNEKYPNGFFGHIEFIQRKKIHNVVHETLFNIEGVTVMDQDSRFLYLIGTDGVPYMPEKKRIKFFDPIFKPEN